MDIQHLKYFLKVAELQHMTQAANALNMAQPSLSKIIHNLENEFHAELFKRNGRKIVLNDNGRILQKYATSIIQNYEQAEYEMEEINIQNVNTITIIINSAATLIPYLTADFMKANPNIKIQFSSLTATGNQPVDYHFDCFLEKKKEHSIRLLEEKCVLVFSSTHRLASLEKVSLSDLKDEVFLYTQGCHSLYDMSYRLASQGGFKPHSMVECISKDTVYSFLYENLGIAIIPEIGWDLSKHSDLVSCNFTEYPLTRYLFMIKNPVSTSRHTSICETFESYCCNYFDAIHSV